MGNIIDILKSKEVEEAFEKYLLMHMGRFAKYYLKHKKILSKITIRRTPIKKYISIYEEE